jgi:hypothetical protein
MMVIGKEIKMIDSINLKGISYPVKFGFEVNDELKAIKVKKINKVNKEELEGKEVYKFSCESEIEDEILKFDITFDTDTYKWVLTDIQ